MKNKKKRNINQENTFLNWTVSLLAPEGTFNYYGIAKWTSHGKKMKAIVSEYPESNTIVNI